MARRRIQRLNAARDGRPRQPGDLGSARRAALHEELAHVAKLLERDPDAAALLLDGVLRQIGAEWFLARAYAVPPANELLGRLAEMDAAFAWRLRLALRAPDARARYVAAQQCLNLPDEHGSAE